MIPARKLHGYVIFMVLSVFVCLLRFYAETIQWIIMKFCINILNRIEKNIKQFLIGYYNAKGVK